MPALELIQDQPQSTPEVKPKKRRRRIQLMETLPKPGWTVAVRNEKGHRVWYTRVEVTGLRPRRYGPFKSQHAALLFLDDLLNEITEGLDCDASWMASEQAVKGRFQNRPVNCIIEDELGSAYRQKHKER